MKTLKFIKKLILGFLAFIFLLFIVIFIAYNHKSNPKNKQVYQTDNPHIFSKTQVSAHRSGAGIMPENTMMAFKNILKDSSFDVDVFEFDLHLTKDEKLVLLHDDKLDRTSNSYEIFGQKDLEVSEKTLAELKKLNMGYKFKASDGSMPYNTDNLDPNVKDDLKIVSLDEILDYLSKYKTYNFIIEIKNDGEKGKRAVDILYDDLKDRSLLKNVIFGSFHKDVSDYKDKKYPNLMRGAYADEVIDFYLAALTNRKNFSHKYDVLQLPYAMVGESKGINFGTTSIINYAHKNNIAVQYWTINDEKDMEYLANIGADCIMSDYPDKLYKIINK